MKEYCHFNRKRLSSNVAKAIAPGNEGMHISQAYEDSANIGRFWNNFSKAFKNVTKTDKKFSPIGWITDMATANFNDLQLIYGEYVLHKIKGCEFHFCQSINHHTSKCSNQERFKIFYTNCIS